VAGTGVVDVASPGIGMAANVVMANERMVTWIFMMCLLVASR
jgi:hypothetical protein